MAGDLVLVRDVTTTAATTTSEEAMDTEDEPSTAEAEATEDAQDIPAEYVCFLRVLLCLFPSPVPRFSMWAHERVWCSRKRVC